MSTLDPEEVWKVVDNLIGPCGPIGDHGLDEVRLKNLEKACLVLENIVFDLCGCARYHNRQEHSVKMIGKRAKEALLEARSCINADFENEEQ